MLLYTANIGGYDTLQVTHQPGFDFKVFNKPMEGISNVKSARYHKITYSGGWEIDNTIWLDSNIKVNCDLKEFVGKWFGQDVDLVLMEHGRDCIYDEMDACIERNKDTIENIERQRQFYLKEQYPKHAGMVGTGIMIRKDSENVSLLMDTWWGVLKEYSHRDQLSFNYALWKCKKDPNFKIKIAYIPYSVFGNEFELIPHEKNNR